MKPPKPMGVAEFVTRLFGSHDRQLRRYLYRILGSEQAVDEVAQDTYTKLFRLCKPGDVRCPHALLFDVATKQAANYLRAERRHRGHSNVTELSDLADNAPHPDRLVAAEQAMHHLQEIIAGLRPKYRAVLELRFYHQLSHQEIAERLHITPDAAQQRTAAAAQECRSKLVALGIDPLVLR